MADVALLAHASGVNVRHLGAVRRRCRLPGVRRTLLEELLARTLKAELRRRMRRLGSNPAEATASHLVADGVPTLLLRRCVAALISDVFGASPEAELYRCCGLKTQLLARFSGGLDDAELCPSLQLFTPLLPVDPTAVAVRMAASMGLQLAPTLLSAVAGLTAEARSSHVTLQPRVRCLDVAACAAGEALMAAVHERLQLEQCVWSFGCGALSAPRVWWVAAFATRADTRPPALPLCGADTWSTTCAWRRSRRARSAGWPARRCCRRSSCCRCCRARRSSWSARWAATPRATGDACCWLRYVAPLL